MIYNKFKGLDISALGMGCMRLPCIDGERTNIDKAAVREMVAYAFEKGINYFDTAWGYHGGESEPCMGEVLSAYPRESFFLATKFPGYDVALMSKVDEIFAKQLERCRVDYFDFYLFHNVCEKNIDGYLDEGFGVHKFLMEQKNNGKIRHLGFSTHGSLRTIKRFLDAYASDLEFCQLQVNWFDWDFQKAKEKIELVSSYGIPVWIMESVRGGSLAKLEPQYEEKLKALRPDATAPEWAFRFLQGIPSAVVTLSGMSNFQQLKENVTTYETSLPLSQKETDVLLSIAGEMKSKTALPCTSCEYCIDHCPMELNIPRLVEVFNKALAEQKETIDVETLGLPEYRLPTACIGCKACEEVCPQGISISEMMAELSEKLKK